MSDSSSQPSHDRAIETIESPPQSIGGILLRLGPGLVIAGSIVGSGELIATTATGAKAGFWLLWLILVGCVIKVFVQVEFGRYSIATGVKTMTGLSQVPGPHIAGRGNWLVWYWVLMFIANVGQLGGIVGGVGQALAISMPLTQAGRSYNEQLDRETRYHVAFAQRALATLKLEELGQTGAATDDEVKLRDQIAALSTRLEGWAPEIVASRLAEIQETLKKLPPPQLNGGDANASYVYHQAVEIVNQRLQEHPDQPELIFVSTKADKDKIKTIQDKKEKKLQQKIQSRLPSIGLRQANDHKIWAGIIAVLTSIVLVMGRYGLIQTFSTVLVASFTLITIVNLIMLQQYDAWAVSGTDLLRGMSFRLPPVDTNQALATALATFGIIGVGASELIAYPYWCLEKGYGRFTGPRDTSQAWAKRAEGWLRVMRWDAWCSMAVYTFATIAFYLLGAAILGRIRLTPEGTEMIRTLSLMYEPVFGSLAQLLFLFGAFAVLYSTFFVANAGQARMSADALGVLGIVSKGEETNRKVVRFLSGLFPLLCLTVYVFFPKPTTLILLSGLMQAMMLPMLAAAALYFRYKRCDKRIMPGQAWDLFLWISAFGMLVAGVWAFVSKIISELSG